MVKKLLFFLFVLSVSTSHADFWLPPTCTDYYSPDSSVYIHVVPACVTLFKKNKLKHLDSCSGDCIVPKPCKATIYKHIGNDLLYSFTLKNLFAPQKVFINNNGTYIITINDWGSAGTGDNVLVIYKNGNLKKNFSLLEISPIKIDNYYTTVSSIWWFAKLEFLNDNVCKITFQDINRQQFEKYFNLKKM